MPSESLIKFANAFELTNHGFTEPVLFDSGEFGFSTLRKPDFTIQGKVSSEVKDEFLTLIHVAIEDEEFLAEHETGRHKLSLYIRLQFVRQQHGRFFVDDTVLKSIKNRPIDLVSYNEYFFDSDKNSFYRKNTPIKASQILKELYQLHTRTNGSWRGLKIKLKVSAIKWASDLLEDTAVVLSGFHKLFFGEKIEFHPILQAFQKTTDRQLDANRKVDETKTIPLFGYDANARMIVSYCAIHFIIFVLLYFAEIHLKFLRIVFENNFLTVCYVIVSLAFMETIFKRILRSITIKIGKWAFDISISNIEI